MVSVIFSLVDHLLGDLFVTSRRLSSSGIKREGDLLKIMITIGNHNSLRRAIKFSVKLYGWEFLAVLFRGFSLRLNEIPKKNKKDRCCQLFFKSIIPDGHTFHQICRVGLQSKGGIGGRYRSEYEEHRKAVGLRIGYMVA